jgi:zinc transport system ATP-binding protein
VYLARSRLGQRDSGVLTVTNALEVEDLTVRLGARDVLRNLSFSVPQGCSLAIIGPNGSGKTVLLRTLVGALPYDGAVRWARGTALGYVPQKLDIERDLPLSGRDFLRAKAALAGASSEEMRQALAAVGLSEEVLPKPIGTLSGGQFQRLLVAFALVGRPTALLLDEPAAGVDAPGQAQLTDVIHGLQATKGLTVLLVSHDLSVVYRDVDYVLCLGRGRAWFGPPRTALTPDVLQELYGSPVALHVHDHT